MMNSQVSTKFMVEVTGYHRHNGVTTRVEFSKEEIVHKHINELPEFRKQLKTELGGQDDIYLMFRQK